MAEPTTTRSRTVTWQDPMIISGSAAGRTGIEFVEAIRRGELPSPPMALLLGFRLAEVSPGRAVFLVEPGEHHYNPIGVVHGGLLATVLDSAMGCAVHATLPAGAGYTTLEIKVNFVRAVTRETGRLRCEAEVVHAGGRTATAQGRAVDQAGKLYAHGTTTCLVVRGTGSSFRNEYEK
jgi:uncharacterized protein (TIGR00369 family)